MNMDDIKSSAARHHEDAAIQLDIAAKLHRDAATQCINGNFDKAQTLATSAAEAETLANRHAMQGLDLYRHHAEEVAEHKNEMASEVAAREAKHAAKAAAE